MKTKYRCDRVVLHDLATDDARRLSAAGDCIVVDANEKAAPCIGCFGCWLKTPGQCVLKDSFQTLGIILPQCEELVIVSQSCYGGYSPGVKKVLDRSIAASLPFFTYRAWKTHHIPRYKTRPRCRVFLYGETSDFEKQIAKELVNANSVNMVWQDTTLTFLDSAEKLWEVWQ